MDPMRVTDAVTLTNEGTTDDGLSVFARYELFGGKWAVVATGGVVEPWDCLSGLSIEPADYPDFEGEQISTEVLRALPLRDARDRIRRLIIEERKRRGEIRELPREFRTPLDFALLAAAYAAEVAQDNPQPIQHLARIHGISRNTISARIRRAREDDMGLLTRPTKTSQGRLTAKAKKILGEAGEDVG